MRHLDLFGVTCRTGRSRDLVTQTTEKQTGIDPRALKKFDMIAAERAREFININDFFEKKLPKLTDINPKITEERLNPTL